MRCLSAGRFTDVMTACSWRATASVSLVCRRPLRLDARRLSHHPLQHPVIALRDLVQVALEGEAPVGAPALREPKMRLAAGDLLGPAAGGAFSVEERQHGVGQLR